MRQCALWKQPKVYLEHFLNSILNSQLSHCSVFTLVYFRLMRERGRERLIPESIISLTYARGDYRT